MKSLLLIAIIISAVSAQLSQDDQNSVNIAWILICGWLVLFMQVGFTMLEVGSVSENNIQTILFENVMDSCVGCVTFFTFGYAFGYGDDYGGVIGTSDWLLLSSDPLVFPEWFFHWAFACNCATIMSGAIAERGHPYFYLMYSVMISGWVHPVVAHWIWNPNGWASAYNDNAIIPAIDFAGAGVVHMVGGWAALVGANFCGGTRHSGLTNPTFMILGVLILWFGWYGFNCGATRRVFPSPQTMNTASRIAVNTSMSAVTTCLSGSILSFYARRQKEGREAQKSRISDMGNSLLFGLVSITAGCATIKPAWCLLIGPLSGVVYAASTYALDYNYLWSSKLPSRFENLINQEFFDPVNAWVVHGVGGLWGMMVAGIFSNQQDIKNAYGSRKIARISHGQRFIYQAVVSIVMIMWSLFWCCLVIYILKKCGMNMKLSPEIIEKGLDSRFFGSHEAGSGPYKAGSGPYKVGSGSHKVGSGEITLQSYGDSSPIGDDQLVIN